MNLKTIVSEAKKHEETLLGKRLARAKKILKDKILSLEEVSNSLDCSPKAAKEIITQLQSDGYNVSLRNGELLLSSDIPKLAPLVVNSKDFFDGHSYKFGALGDTHLCNRHARMDVLNSLYDIYEQEGITRVFHSGNAVDGECRFNKHELIVRAGYEPQMEYFANEYPQRKGIETWFITGEDHEGWWTQREGINVGLRMEQSAKDKGRTDLRWIGHVERDIQFKTKKGSAWGRIMHPGGGSAYAISYAEQKLVESFQSGEKPRFLLIGHYHKFNQGYPREVHTVQTACTCDQTAFLRRQKIQVMVGGTIITFHQAESGEINRFGAEFLNYYDRKFYAVNNKYQNW